MTVKSIPLPRLRLTRIRLNPTIKQTVTLHVPCNYELTVGGIEYQCPCCHGWIDPSTTVAFKRVELGVYTVGVWFQDCDMCHTAVYRVHAADIMKNWER